MITCCADCEKRYINCHSKCEAYLQQRAEHEVEKDVIRDIRKKNDAMYCYSRDSKRRTEKRANRKRWR